LEDFDNSKILVLISVSALAKGFDKPYVECILDMRPLRRSLAEYVQMVGRGLRCNPGKKECYLLDFTGNIDRFLPDFEDVYYNGVNSLDMSQRLNRVRTDKESKNAICCPVCDNLYMHKKCTNCGYEKPIEKRVVEVELENIKLEPVTICHTFVPAMKIEEENTHGKEKHKPAHTFFGRMKQLFNAIS
jgi:superfamily II DNA or RNA helicase